MNDNIAAITKILLLLTILVASSGGVTAFCVKKRQFLSGDRQKHRKEAWWMVPATVLLAYGSTFIFGLEAFLLLGLGIFGCIYYSGVLIFVRRIQ